ncbi:MULTISPECIES: ATP-grasp domain-containing protein [Virgibacillus]|uniref:Alpha-L-glutamate ligase n=1 Tax=Virgibacillus kapii TaxID=1638645 RepID=A0ABQ2D8Y5_9BACI|nr:MULTISPECIES: ATP-grasp domain-containing protein [Virgibacillus]EQB35817.1 hypothetical protein M948_12320 [Virgibacillus sp. CM-4]MYL41620.1 ATP-grasp domain-containing protein [Virgibacillus massiliensis]GGJ49392.1 alpha-L-glutamate ligase [Virgibacillus kapii]
MLKGWIVYSKKDFRGNQSYINWFIKEAARQSLQLQLVIRENITIGIENNQRRVYFNGEMITDLDFAIVRTIDPMLSTHLEACNIIVFNSAYVSRVCNDKALTHHIVQQLNIPMVDTIYSKKEQLSSHPPLPYPFIIKETSGRSGKQVYYIADKQSYLRCQQLLRTTNLVIQSCHVQMGKDLRVFVVGKKIVAAVLRQNDTDFRANFKLGGSATLYKLNNEERCLIKKIVEYFDFGMVGIDFLIDYDGNLLFNEIEDIVGSRTLSNSSDINILRIYVDHISEKLKRRKLL